MKFMSTLLVAAMLLTIAEPALARHHKHHRYVRSNNYNQGRVMARTNFNYGRAVGRNPASQAFKQQQGAAIYAQQTQNLANIELQRQQMNSLNSHYNYFNSPYNQYGQYGQPYNPYNSNYYGNGGTGSRILNSIFR